MMPDNEFDTIVIGAGISGIAFARFYLDIHPSCRLAVIEEDSCVGGAWSASRSYDEFWSQGGRRMVGFSDVEFTVPKNAPTYWGCCEAKHITKYLEDYADNHVYEGRTLRSRILFRRRVEKVEKGKDDGIWTIDTQGLSTNNNNQRLQRFKSSKIAVAAGLTSLANLPSFLQHDSNVFKSHVCHHKDFGYFSKTLLNTSECKKITVLGAGKSATDIVYECVKKKKDVSWIIRTDGEGPPFLFQAPIEDKRYENAVEKGTTRLSQAFSPSSFMPDTWWVRLLHGTFWGRDFVRKKTQAFDQSVRDAPAYRDREGALPCFKYLEPTTSAFWFNGPVGLKQHDDFWDVIAQNVNVYRNDVSSLKPHSIVLDNDVEIPADAILCGTGWKPDYPFFSNEQARLLGLPYSPDQDSLEDDKLWNSLIESAERKILEKFLILQDPPPHNEQHVSTTTLRLYNGIAPLEDDSAVFLGRAQLSNSFRTAEAQAIWATAFFDGNIKMPPPDQAQREIAYMNAFSKRRYPSHGAVGDNFFFELVWYTDKLLADVGLKSHLKGWWANWVEPCLAMDFKHVKDEYQCKFGS